MKKNRAAIKNLTKDTPFEDVLASVTPMIKSISGKTNGVYGLEREDLEQELSIQVFKSWQSWDPDGGTKFSTYVYDALVKTKNFIVRTAKAKRRNGGQQPVSLDASFESGQPNDAEFCLYSIIAESDICDPEMYVYVREILDVANEVLDTMSDRAQDVIRNLLDGYTQTEVSEMTGVTQSLVSYHSNLFRKKLRQELELRDFDLPFTNK